MPGIKPFETVTVDTDKVACAGEGDLVGGHPKVYLNLGPGGRVECPYCSRLFLKRGAPAELPPNQTSKSA
ncbi:MAG: zinc-finger domain-containing protein [Stellaceae bacterium]